MYMLSKFMFDAYYSQRKYLVIEPHEPKNFISNFYYFRFGAEKRGKEVVKTAKSLAIPKNGFVQVWSMERFALSERVLGLFGNVSSMVERGLQLVHSPSLDPGFEGSLALGVKNNTQDTVELELGQAIGKILFFDVSDTVLSVEEFVENVLKQKVLEERKKAGDGMLEMYSRFMNDQTRN